MTPRDRLVTAAVGTTITQAEEHTRTPQGRETAARRRSGEARGADHPARHSQAHAAPESSKDQKGRLLVGAAIGVVGDYVERAQELLHARV